MSAPKLAGTAKWAKTHSGFLDDMSEEQAAILKEFTAAISEEDMASVRMPHETVDSCSARFLRARKYDIVEATKMFTACAAWKRENKVMEMSAKSDFEILHGTHADEVAKFYQFVVLDTHDKEGHPIYIDRTGKVDVEGLLMITQQEHLLDWHVAYTERDIAQRFAAATAARKTPERPVDSVCTIMDLDGLSLSQINRLTLNYVKAVTAIDQAYYPETMARCFLVNSPTIFSVAWKVIKGFLDPRTVDKIKIISNNGKKELLKFIDEDQLPVEYGGSYVREGGTFPSSRTEHAAISSGKKLTWNVPAKAGQKINIKWFPRGGSIKISIAWQPAKGEESMVLDPELRGPEFHVHNLEAKADGTYVVLFDNYENWTQRKVFYRYDVEAKPVPATHPHLEAHTDAEEAAAAAAGTAGGAGGGAGAADAAAAVDAAATADAAAAAGATTAEATAAE